MNSAATTSDQNANRAAAVVNSGDAQNTLSLTRQLGILYGKAEGSTADNYLVDHSAAIILLDPDGAFRAVFGIPHDPTLIASDFLAIKTYYEAIQ